MAIASKIGPFRVVSHIASGGMGEVYLAKHEEKGRLVAVKVLPEEFLKDRKRSQYLDRELKIARKLRHPNVVDIYGLYRENGIGYLIMEYLDGGNLRKHIKARDLTLADILEIMLKICEGLHYIHNHKLEDGHFHSIIHRDIKPENILLSKNGRIKVADFGLSLHEDTWAWRKTKSRAGTPLYMSPEQIRGKPLDVRTDIYSLGLVLYELLTGQLPYKAPKREMYMKMVISKKTKPAPPSYVDKEIPREFDDITLKALRKNPDERYQTVTEIMLDLRRLAPGLAPEDLSQEFQFMRDIKVAASGRDATDSPAWEQAASGVSATVSIDSETSEDASESTDGESMQDCEKPAESDSHVEDKEQLRLDLLRLHREMIYAEDPEKAHSVRTVDPRSRTEASETPADDDKAQELPQELPKELPEEPLEEPLEDTAGEPAVDIATGKSGETFKQTVVDERFDSKAENEDEQIDSKTTSEEPVGEFLPATRIEDDTAPAESEGLESALAALGENSGIVDGAVVADVKSGGNGETTGPDESKPACTEKSEETVPEEAVTTGPQRATNRSERGTDMSPDEKSAPSTRRAAKPSDGNGADGGVEIEPVHADDEPEPDGFGPLDIEEIEDFIFIGRTKG